MKSLHIILHLSVSPSLTLCVCDSRLLFFLALYDSLTRPLSLSLSLFLYLSVTVSLPPFSLSLSLPPARLYLL